MHSVLDRLHCVQSLSPGGTTHYQASEMVDTSASASQLTRMRRSLHEAQAMEALWRWGAGLVFLAGDACFGGDGGCISETVSSKSVVVVVAIAFSASAVSICLFISRSCSDRLLIRIDISQLIWSNCEVDTAESRYNG